MGSTVWLPVAAPHAEDELSLPWVPTVRLWELIIQGWSWMQLLPSLAWMRHLHLPVSRRCLSCLQAATLQGTICYRMMAIGACKGAAALISRLDPARFGHVEQEVGQSCARYEVCPVDYMTALGWDGYGGLMPRASFASAVSSHADHSAVPTDSSWVC